MIGPNTFLLVLFGESGCGKNSVAEALHDLSGWSLIQSRTSRKPRPSEITDMQAGKRPEYIFQTRREVKKLIPSALEWTEFNGNLYCCMREDLDKGNMCIFDLHGLEMVRKAYAGSDRTVIGVYIRVVEEERRRRMLKRGDNPAKVEERLEHDRVAFEGACDKADIVISDGIMEWLPADIAHMIDAFVQGVAWERSKHAF